MPFLPWGAVAASHWQSFWTFVLPTWLGGLAVYLLLPRPRPYPTWAGVLCGAAALLLAGFFIVGPGNVTLPVLPQTILFYAFSALAIIFGTLLVTQNHPARAALSFTVVVLSTCGLFLLLAAPFLMVATIIIYAGAIIVTFLFVLMLAQQSGYSDADARSREPLLATITGFVLLGVLLYVLRVSYQMDNLIRQTDRALAQSQSKQILAVVGTPGKSGFLFGEYANFFAAQRRPELQAQVNELLDNKWSIVASDSTDPQTLKDILTRLRQLGVESYTQLSWAEPVAIKEQGIVPLPLSSLSGPPSNVGTEQLRRDADGMPQLPQDNTAYLGRSLFTDYLLPVELGGTLLLVATIGAIAIAHRKVESRADNAPKSASLPGRPS